MREVKDFQGFRDPCAESSTTAGGPSQCGCWALSCNEPFGSRPEPGAYLIAPILLLPPGEVPEGKAGDRAQARRSCAEAHSKAAAGNGRYKERPIQLCFNPIIRP